VLAAFCAAIIVASASQAFAATIDSAVIKPRIFNDDPTSTLVTVNSYAAAILISDTPDQNTGFANLHVWHLADAGVEHSFPNNQGFSFSSNFALNGTGQGEGGLQLSPWWSPDADGLFNFRTTDGEIAVFGGRLPFYSFTGSQGLHYVKGTTVRVGMIYNPHSLSMADPATIVYNVTMPDLTTYTSGPIAFDQGNPAEGFGSWGHLEDARLGGQFKPYISGSGTGNGLTAVWSNISFAATVPEPATLSLLGLSLLGFIGIRRRAC